MVWRRDLIRLFRMPTRIISGIAQPILFLFVLGAGLENAIGSQGAAGVDYQQFLFPGILAMSVITSSLFSAIAIVWDREFGFMREMLVAPVRRSSIVLRQGARWRHGLGGAGARARGVRADRRRVVHRDELLPDARLPAAARVLAHGVRHRRRGRMQRMESFQMVMALVMQPMIFLSGAIFPLNNLPEWLAVLTRLNPATYGVDGIRRVVLPSAVPLTIGDWVVPLWFDAVVTLGFGVAMLTLAVKLFSKTE